MRDKRNRYVAYFKDRFGVEPATWDSYDLNFRSQSVHLVDADPPELDWDVKDRGFRIARSTSHAFKPTTRGVQWLGNRITESRVSVGNRGLERLLDREPVTALEASSFPERGFVAIIFRAVAIGCGFWTGEQLETQISKAHGREFPREELADGETVDEERGGFSE